MYQIYVFIPESHLEQVKNAMFVAGAGRVGNYSCCSWQVKGEGQFRAEAGSAPFIGKVGELAKVIEYKVETVCDEDKLEAVIAAMKQTHPYEVPAYGVIELKHDINIAN